MPFKYDELSCGFTPDYCSNCPANECHGKCVCGPRRPKRGRACEGCGGTGCPRCGCSSTPQQTFLLATRLGWPRCECTNEEGSSVNKRQVCDKCNCEKCVEPCDCLPQPCEEERKIPQVIKVRSRSPPKCKTSQRRGRPLRSTKATVKLPPRYSKEFNSRVTRGLEEPAPEFPNCNSEKERKPGPCKPIISEETIQDKTVDINCYKTNACSLKNRCDPAPTCLCVRTCTKEFCVPENGICRRCKPDQQIRRQSPVVGTRNTPNEIQQLGTDLDPQSYHDEELIEESCVIS